MTNKDFDQISSAMRRLSKNPGDMLRSNPEFLFPEERNFFDGVFIKGDFDVSDDAVDAKLNEIQETALSAIGLAFFTMSVIRSSYQNLVFSSLSTDRILFALAMKAGQSDDQPKLWGQCWSALTTLELLEGIPPVRAVFLIVGDFCSVCIYEQQQIHAPHRSCV